MGEKMADEKPNFIFWIVASLGLMWNLMGCLNYFAQIDPDTVLQMPERYQLLINSRPLWATVGFFIAVFGGAFGCILLLLRRRAALVVLGVSLLGVIAVSAFTLMLVGMPISMMLSLAIATGLFWYASTLMQSEFLR